MRYIREGLYRLGSSVVVFGMFMFCGLITSSSILLKGEEGCIEALEFNKRIIR